MRGAQPVMPAWANHDGDAPKLSDADIDPPAQVLL